MLNVILLFRVRAENEPLALISRAKLAAFRKRFAAQRVYYHNRVHGPLTKVVAFSLLCHLTSSAPSRPPPLNENSYYQDFGHCYYCLNPSHGSTYYCNDYYFCYYYYYCCYCVVVVISIVIADAGRCRQMYTDSQTVKTAICDIVSSTVLYETTRNKNCIFQQARKNKSYFIVQNDPPLKFRYSEKILFYPI